MKDRLLDRMFADLDALFQSPTKTYAWLHAYNKHLGGIPAELIQSEMDLPRVVAHLDALRTGGSQ